MEKLSEENDGLRRHIEQIARVEEDMKEVSQHALGVGESNRLLGTSCLSRAHPRCKGFV